jgi:hypothetical protein
VSSTNVSYHASHCSPHPSERETVDRPLVTICALA